jgi:hypothetical protein
LLFSRIQILDLVFQEIFDRSEFGHNSSVIFTDEIKLNSAQTGSHPGEAVERSGFFISPGALNGC